MADPGAEGPGNDHPPPLRRGAQQAAGRAVNAAEVLGSFFSRENPDSNYARGIYWPDMATVRQACRVPDYYTLIEPDGRALPCCLVEIAHQGEVGNVMNRPLQEVWEGQAFQQFRQERIPFCQQCSSPRNRTLGLIPSKCRQFRD